MLTGPYRDPQARPGRAGVPVPAGCTAHGQGIVRRAPVKEEGVDDQGQPGYGWTVVLRRRPARIVAGRPEGGYTDAYEIICCDCGDHPDLDYRQVPPALQRIRGPYRLLTGVAAYEKHVGRHRGEPARPASNVTWHPGKRHG